MGCLGGFELQLQLVRNQGDELRIRGLSFGVADGVAEEPLQGVQVAPIPGDLDGMTDGTFHAGWRGTEGLGYLGVEHLGDGINGLVSPLEGLPEVGNLEGFL